MDNTWLLCVTALFCLKLVVYGVCFVGKCPRFMYLIDSKFASTNVQFVADWTTYGFSGNKLHINIIFSIKLLALWCLLLGLWAPVFKTLPSMRHKKAKSCTLLSVCFCSHVYFVGLFFNIARVRVVLETFETAGVFQFVSHYRVIYIGKILEALTFVIITYISAKFIFTFKANQKNQKH